jgi:hypothetical protein
VPLNMSMSPTDLVAEIGARNRAGFWGSRTRLCVKTDGLWEKRVQHEQNHPMRGLSSSSASLLMRDIICSS